eukprot:TRINITY_DN939_c0_g1_i2.p1 TRINITY_DN939_c0_g1~~TRINITY_DN939_c0_g1_i2.p1  ORF type:complete len:467 (-),score=80.96 TRINITY_DN939_c0_g1_i2:142-1542(-)
MCIRDRRRVHGNLLSISNNSQVNNMESQTSTAVADIFYILCSPIPSHLLPILGFLQHLKKQGLDIDYHGPADLGEKYLKGLVSYTIPQSTLVLPEDPALKTINKYKRYLHSLLTDIPTIEARWQAAGKKPKVIIADLFAVNAKILARRHPEIKLISFYSTFVLPEANMRVPILSEACPDSLDDMNQEAFERFNLRIRTFEDVVVNEGTVISCVAPFFAEYTMPPSYDRSKFIGPGFRDDPPNTVVDATPFFGETDAKELIYVCFGTTPMAASNDWILPLIIEALKDTEYNVLMSVGRREVEPLKGVEIPSNFKVEPFVPQMRVLGKASVFVTHGGAGGILEAMSVAVPMACVPVFGDQHGNALTLDRLKIGKQLKITKEDERAKTIEIIKTAILDIVKDPEYKANCVKYSKQIDAQKSREKFYEIVIGLMGKSAQCRKYVIYILTLSLLSLYLSLFDIKFQALLDY